MDGIRPPRLTCSWMVVLLTLGIGSANSLAQNQVTTLAVSSSNVLFAVPTVEDYANGFVQAAQGVTFSVSTAGASQLRTATISIRATTTGLGSGKAVADVQWRRADLPDWNSLTISNTEVERRQMTLNGNDQWTNTIFFRVVVRWQRDAPATYTADFQITLSQTFP